jgi:hypothetical protein
MWNICFVIPVIIGATGIVTKGLKKYLETIPGKHSIDSLQKNKKTKKKKKNSCTRNITHYKESSTIINLKWWVSRLVQEEKYQEKPVTRKERKK